jgi:spore maturation protein CgeB
MSALEFVFLGLSITSSWGNGHATTYRGLVRELARSGHRITFLERDLPFYAENRDLADPSFCTTHLYGSLEELKDRFADTLRSADVVIVGSYVPEGVAIGDWVQSHARGVVAFYDIDTPVTLRALVDAAGATYLARRQIPHYDLYLSFTGGPTLVRLEREFGAPRARALYCSVDPDTYCQASYAEEPEWDLGYLGTYSPDRQPTVDRFLCEPARAWPKGRFIVAGPQYPDAELGWPANVRRVHHLSPAEHRAFYNRQRFTLNVTRADMIAAGWSPSVRLFEAAACATPIVSDVWQGIEAFFEPGREILLARTTADVLQRLQTMPETARLAMGDRARHRVLAEHTAAHRAEALVRYLDEVWAERGARRRMPEADARPRPRLDSSTHLRGMP